MDEFDQELLAPLKDNRRKVKIVRNGDPSDMRICLLKEHINFEELALAICEKMEISKREASIERIFKTGGVEVSNEDVQYIKNGDILFVSFGDDFDESSNFAVYKLKRCLGSGGYGKVFEAKNRITKEKVAIKMIDVSKIRNAKDTEMTYKELIALKNLNHRCILKVHNCFTLQKEMKIALVLEYLEGGDLREYMQTKKILSEKEAQKLFSQLFLAISYCHKESIIHRDLKLENIMFVDKEHEKLKVVDFGICGRYSLDYIDFTEAGSIRYLAPEVITSHAPAQPSIDVWAMGCILFWMVTGGSPFPQNTREGVQESILKGKWCFNEQQKSTLTSALRNLIARMLVVKWQNRITTGEIGEHPWMQRTVEDIVEDEKAQKIAQQDANEEDAVDEQKKKKSIVASKGAAILNKGISSQQPNSSKANSPYISSGSPVIAPSQLRNYCQNSPQAFYGSSDAKAEAAKLQNNSTKGNQNRRFSYESNSYYQKLYSPQHHNVYAGNQSNTNNNNSISVSKRNSIFKNNGSSIVNSPSQLTPKDNFKPTQLSNTQQLHNPNNNNNNNNNNINNNTNSNTPQKEKSSTVFTFDNKLKEIFDSQDKLQQLKESKVSPQQEQIRHQQQQQQQQFSINSFEGGN